MERIVAPSPTPPLVGPSQESNPVVGLGHIPEIPENPRAYTNKSLNIIRTLLAKTIEHCTDLSALVKGKSVLLKPNLVRPSAHNPFAVVTDERVILALVGLLRGAGAREIHLGDNPGYGLSLRTALTQTSDLKDRLHGLGVHLHFFDDEDKVVVPNPEALLFDSMVLPRVLLDTEIYVNLPKMKTHMHTLVTLGIKNQYGLILDDQRMTFHRNDINVKIVDILRVVRPHLTVIDGIMAVQGQAPLSGSAIPDMNTVLASTDVVAGDTIGATVMGIAPDEVTMLRLAKQENLGCTDLARIMVRGACVTDVQRSFKRPVISSVAAYPQFTCVEGGACFGCLSALRHALDKLHCEGHLRDGAHDTIYLGKPMPDMKNLRQVRGKLWCFGSCTADLVYSHQRFANPAHFIPGCPPHILDFYQAYLNQDDLR